VRHREAVAGVVVLKHIRAYLHANITGIVSTRETDASKPL
jgi:hypothetical protein